MTLMCSHYRSGPCYREPSFDVMSWIQQVSTRSIRVGEFERFSSKDAKLIQIQVIPPPPSSCESIPWKNNCQPVLLFAFFPSCPCFPFPAPGTSPVVLSPLPARGAVGGSWVVNGVVLPRRTAPTAPRGACLQEAQRAGGAGVRPKQPRSHPHGGLSRSAWASSACARTTRVPIFCSSLRLHVRVQQQRN